MADYSELIKTLRDYASARKGEIAELTSKAADAIEKLQQTVAHYKGCADDWYKEACDYKAAVPKWIPVTERLPEANKPVLVVSVGKLGQFVSVDWVNAFGETRWAHSVTVTHWMPLPEPPKEETT